MVRVIATGDLGVERGVYDQGADGIPADVVHHSVFDLVEPVTNYSSSGKKARVASSRHKLVELEPVEYPQPPALDLEKLKPKK